MTRTPPPPVPAPTTDPWWRRLAREWPGVSHHATLRGARLHYRAWSRNAGPLLLFVHGFGGHTHWWDWIAPCFADDSDVVAVDLSGMGDSDHRETYDADCFALDILDLVEHLGTGPAAVVGHSFGGRSLLQACALDSASGTHRRIAHAIVVDTKIRFPGDPMPEALPVGGRGQYVDYESARRRFRLNPPQPVADDAMLDDLARHSLRHVDGHWRWKFDTASPVGLPQDGHLLLPRIETLTDIVYGASSSIVARADAERCVAELHQGRGPVAIPLAGHHVMLDQPIALVATLRALLAR